MTELRTVVFDVETYLIEPGLLAPKLVCLTYQFLDKGTARLVGNATPKKLRKVCERIVSGKYRVCGHNVAFDFGVLVAAYPELMPAIFALYERGLVHDTGIYDEMAHIASGWTKQRPDGERPKYHLADLVRRILQKEMKGKKGDDIWRLRYCELDGIPVEDWPEEDGVNPGPAEYALDDTILTGEIVRIQLSYAANIPTITLQHSAAWSLHLMSCWGVRTDPVAVAELEASLGATLEGYVATLQKEGLIRANGVKDMEAVKARVTQAYEAMGRKAPKTAKGNVKTSREVLDASEDPVLLTLAGHGAVAKVVNTFLPVLRLGVVNSINPRYRVLVDSGRTSASKPNIQQLPREGGVRQCFKAREGYTYLQADYHVAELCSLAQVLITVLGKSRMAELLNEGKDLHLATAGTVLNLSYEETLKRYDAGDKTVANARQTSKILNFGLPGGLSAGGLMHFAKGYGKDIDFQEASRLRDLWLETYPEMRLYFQWISNQCGMGTFTSCHPVTGYIRGNVGYTDGANQQFQHLTATGCKYAMFEISKQCYVDESSPLFGSRPWGFVHDEFLLESPLAWASDAATRLEELMVAGMRRVLPDVDCRADALLMPRWYKGAKAIRNSDGELLVWQPTDV